MSKFWLCDFKLLDVSLFNALLTLELKLFHAVFIASGVGIPPLLMCAFLNVVALVKSSNALGFWLKKLVALLNEPFFIALATPIAAVTPPTANAVFPSPPLPPILGKAVLATPLTSIPVAAPIWSFNIPKPSCLIPSLDKFLAFVTTLDAFNTVPKSFVDL